jgi:hypothetical protein
MVTRNLEMISWFLAARITQLQFADLAAPGEIGNQLGALGYAGVPIEERRDDQCSLQRRKFTMILTLLFQR